VARELQKASGHTDRVFNPRPLPEKHSMTLQAIRSFLTSEDGPTAIEYGVMLALIFAVCLGAVGLVGQNTQNSFSYSANSINAAFQSAS
jgi:pilus assembly protein Flp/PilA